MAEQQTIVEQHNNFISGFAIAALVFGILSFVQVVGIEKSLAAIIFGALALRRIKKDERMHGRKLAIGGIMLGAAYLILVSILVIQYWPQLRGMQRRQQQQSIQPQRPLAPGQPAAPPQPLEPALPVPEVQGQAPEIILR